jgi:hypothetical protein
MKVYVSAMETPSLFWIQIIDNENNALNTLTSEMTEYYNVKENRELHTLKKVNKEKLYIYIYIYNIKFCVKY